MIEELDFTILDWIQKNFRCGFFDFLMPKISLIGEHGICFIVIGLLLVGIKSYRRAGITILSSMLVGMLIGNVFLKKVVARSRPCWIDTSVGLIVAIPSDTSFPSGHVLQACIVATILLHFDRRLGIAASVLAVLMAFSRLYLYVHFPSDVLAGAAIGIVIGVAGCIVSDTVVRRRDAKMQVQTEAAEEDQTENDIFF